MASDHLVLCPYDESHMIRYSRYPYHLVKCRENNPAAARDLVTCPFNARHIVPRKELKMHMETCENKCSLEPFPVFGDVNHEGATKHNAVAFSTWQSPPCEENWEKDSFTESAFVLREYGNYQPYSFHETTYDNFTPSVAAKPSQGACSNIGNSPAVKARQNGTSATNHKKTESERPRHKRSGKGRRKYK